jgi:hypothetical protein
MTLCTIFIQKHDIIYALKYCINLDNVFYNDINRLIIYYALKLLFTYFKIATILFSLIKK